MSEECETFCIKFEDELTEKQLIIFHELCDLQSAYSAGEARTAYKAGFKDGVAMMIEVQI